MFNVFAWIRNGVRQAVLAGLADPEETQKHFPSGLSDAGSSSAIAHCDWCSSGQVERTCQKCGLSLCGSHTECPECETDEYLVLADDS